jgi:uncharacterized protein
MPIRPTREWTFDNPMVLCGFPSQGLVGAIVASYLVPKLDMQLVATLDDPNLPPVASVRDGRAISPVQIFASTTRCGMDESCDQLVVIRSDAAPEPQHVDDISREIMGYVDEIGAGTVVTLEGAPAEGLDDVFAVPNLHCEIDHEAVGAQAFPDGSLGGFSASLLTEGNSEDTPVLCLFTGVAEDHPDAEAAGRLVGVADTLVPGIKMESKALMERAKSYEDDLRAALEEQQRSMGETEDPSAMMYG